MENETDEVYNLDGTEITPKAKDQLMRDLMKLTVIGATSETVAAGVKSQLPTEEYVLAADGTMPRDPGQQVERGTKPAEVHQLPTSGTTSAGSTTELRKAA